MKKLLLSLILIVFLAQFVVAAYNQISSSEFEVTPQSYSYSGTPFVNMTNTTMLSNFINQQSVAMNYYVSGYEIPLTEQNSLLKFGIPKNANYSVSDWDTPTLTIKGYDKYPYFDTYFFNDSVTTPSESSYSGNWVNLNNYNDSNWDTYAYCTSTSCSIYNNYTFSYDDSVKIEYKYQGASEGINNMGIDCWNGSAWITVANLQSSSLTRELKNIPNSCIKSAGWRVVGSRTLQLRISYFKYLTKFYEFRLIFYPRFYQDGTHTKYVYIPSESHIESSKVDVTPSWKAFRWETTPAGTDEVLGISANGTRIAVAYKDGYYRYITPEGLGFPQFYTLMEGQFTDGIAYDTAIGELNNSVSGNEWAVVIWDTSGATGYLNVLYETNSWWNPPIALGSSRPRNVEIGDIDGDGENEIVVTDDAPTVYSIEANKTINYAKTGANELNICGTGIFENSLTLGKFDGEATDISVFCAKENQLIVLNGTDGIREWNLTDVNFPNYLSYKSAITSGNFSDESGDEIALVFGNGYLYLINSTGQIINSTQIISTSGPVDIEKIHLDNNYDDLAILFNNTVELVDIDNGTISPITSNSVSPSNSIAISDLDSGGFDDIILGAINYNVYSYIIPRNITLKVAGDTVFNSLLLGSTNVDLNKTKLKDYGSEYIPITLSYDSDGYVGLYNLNISYYSYPENVTVDVYSDGSDEIGYSELNGSQTYSLNSTKLQNFADTCSEANNRCNLTINISKANNTGILKFSELDIPLRYNMTELIAIDDNSGKFYMNETTNIVPNQLYQKYYILKSNSKVSPIGSGSVSTYFFLKNQSSTKAFLNGNDCYYSTAYGKVCAIGLNYYIGEPIRFYDSLSNEFSSVNVSEGEVTAVSQSVSSYAQDPYRTTEAGGYAYIYQNVTLTNPSDTGETLSGNWSVTSRSGWNGNNVSGTFSLVDGSSITFRANMSAQVINKTQSSYNFYDLSDNSIHVDAQTKAYYTVYGTNNDTMNFTNVLIQTTIPSIYSNTTPYIFIDNLNAGESYLHRINLTGIPVAETGYSLSSSISGDYKLYTYTGEITVYDNKVSSYPIIYEIPTSRFTGFVNRSTLSVKVDSKTTGINFSVSPDNNTLIINVSTTFSSSSLEAGVHTVTVDYSVYGGAGVITEGAGGGGAGPTPKMSFSPDRIDINIEDRCQTTTLNISWDGPDTPAKINVLGDIANFTVTPRTGDTILLVNSSVQLPIKVCINNTLKQDITYEEKSWSGTLEFSVKLPTKTIVKKVPVVVKKIGKITLPPEPTKPISIAPAVVVIFILGFVGFLLIPSKNEKVFK